MLGAGDKSLNLFLLVLLVVGAKLSRMLSVWIVNNGLYFFEWDLNFGEKASFLNVKGYLILF
jgi:hypothetical protein